MSIFSDVNRAFRDIGKIKGWIQGLEKQLKSVVSDIKGLKKDVEGALKDAKRAISEVKKVAGQVEGVGKEVKGLANKVEDLPETIKAEAEKAVKDWVEELAKAITKEGLKKFRASARAANKKLNKLTLSQGELVDEINVLSIYLELGPAKLTWADFYNRSSTIVALLDKHINEPPSFKRSEIIELILALGPTSINLGLSVNFALVISSKELGVGGGFGDIGLKLFAELADVILDEMGVPN